MRGDKGKTLATWAKPLFKSTAFPYLLAKERSDGERGWERQKGEGRGSIVERQRGRVKDRKTEIDREKEKLVDRGKCLTEC